MCNIIFKETLLCQSGILLRYIETEKWADNTVIDTNLHIDGLIYIQEGDKFYVL